MSRTNATVAVLAAVSWTIWTMAAVTLAADVPSPASRPAADGAEIDGLIRQLGSPAFTVRDRATKKLISLGEAARHKLVAKAAEQGLDAEVSARIKVILQSLPPDVVGLSKGRKVLMFFEHWPVVDIKRKPSSTYTDSEYRKANEALRKEILASLKKAGVSMLHMVCQTEAGKMGTLTYSALMLLDCRGKAPEQALAKVPYRTAGIVFTDGRYERALPVGDPPAWSSGFRKKGQVPAPFAFRSWGSRQVRQRLTDLERYRGFKGVVKVKYTPPPKGAGGSAGRVKLTPEEGHTLLEVFLLTGAEFKLAASPPPPPPVRGGQ